MQVTAVLSQAGLGAVDNDDCAGFAQTDAGLYAWVIDGATSVADQDYLGAGRTDVAWYANALSERLCANAVRGLGLKALHAEAVREVATAYADLLARAPEPPPPFAQPFAAVTMARLAAGALELYELGDCPAFFIGDDDSVTRLTWVKDGESEESRARVVAVQSQVGFAPKAVWADRLDALRRERIGHVNARPLRASTPVAGAVFGGREQRLDIGQARALVMMSDGFERFAVKYELGDDCTMVRRLLAEGPEPLLAELRAVEEADPDCRRFPRLKPSDDATCLVVALR